jgi:cellobiose-specific phosphotransferase system component IIB
MKQELMNGAPPGRALFTHTRNLEVITLAGENRVDIICLPPHNSHEMQPLDKAFMGPLVTFYFKEIEKLLRSHPGRVVTVNQIGELTYTEMHTSELQQAR